MSPGANEGATPFFVYILGRLLEHNLITIFTCYVLDVDCRRVFRTYLVRFLRPRGCILDISATLTSRGLRPFNMIPATILATLRPLITVHVNFLIKVGGSSAQWGEALHGSGVYGYMGVTRNRLVSHLGHPEKQSYY